MAKISDVARLAGVSIATVSQTLSGNRPVSEATKAKVRAAAARLGYRPNHVARAMVTGRTHTLGLLVPDIANPFFAELVRAVERTAGERGYMTLVCSSDLDALLEERYLLVMLDKHVDALLCLLGTGHRPACLEEVVASGIPLIVMDEDLPFLPGSAYVVTVDNERGGRLAATHLAGLGHLRIGAVAAPQALPTAFARLSGFRHGLADFGLSLDGSAIVEADSYTLQDGRVAAGRLLDLRPDLTALWCANDLIALGAIQAAQARGIVVPHDLSVVGFDNNFVSSLVTPTLTTIGQPLTRMGSTAANLAVDLVEGNPAASRRIQLDVELIVRSSTARVARRDVIPTRRADSSRRESTSPEIREGG